MPHSKDEECTVDQYGECTVCHVAHGEPCNTCGGSGYHHDECPVSSGMDIMEFDIDTLYFMMFGESLPHLKADRDLLLM